MRFSQTSFNSHRAPILSLSSTPYNPEIKTIQNAFNAISEPRRRTNAIGHSRDTSSRDPDLLYAQAQPVFGREYGPFTSFKKDRMARRPGQDFVRGILVAGCPARSKIVSRKAPDVRRRVQLYGRSCQSFTCYADARGDSAGVQEPRWTL